MYNILDKSRITVSKNYDNQPTYTLQLKNFTIHQQSNVTQTTTNGETKFNVYE